MAVGHVDRVLAIVVFIEALAGCGATLRPVDLTELRARRPTTLLLYSDRNDDFTAPAGSAAEVVSPLGSVLYAARRGAEIREANGIVDPSLQLGEALAEDFAAAHGLEIVHLAAEGGTGPTFKRVPRGGADLILEVRTIRWSVEPVPGTFPGQEKRYGVHLEVSVKLTDSRDQTVLAERECVGDDPQIVRAHKARTIPQAQELTSSSPNEQEILADGALLLKAELKRAAARCDAEVRDKVLLLDSSPLR